MRLRDVRRAAWRWWWLLLALPLVGGVAAYGLLARQQPVYLAEATLFISPAQRTRTLDDLFAIQGTQELAPTYRQLVPTKPVLDGVVQELGLPYSWETLRDKVFASTVTGTQILIVSAADPDPQQAAAIANAVARHFSDVVARLALDLAAPARTQLDRTIAAYDRQITEAQARLGPSAATPIAADVAPGPESAVLGGDLADLRAARAALIARRDSGEIDTAAAAAQVYPAVEAVPPTVPTGPGATLAALFGVAGGLTVAVGAIVCLELARRTVTAESGLETPTG